ncbi:hypothetical protein F5Y16DRAFT_399470 [Xylariaceae sp. FL0255]|nr:hypothetical protein F5Y16DRAFT_399470 [Xylariaceae sp. FL0255]
MPTWFKAAWTVAELIAKFAATGSEEIGQRVLYRATLGYPARSNQSTRKTDEDVAVGTDGVLGSGACGIRTDGSAMPQAKREKAFRALDGSLNEPFPEFA